MTIDRVSLFFAFYLIQNIHQFHYEVLNCRKFLFQRTIGLELLNYCHNAFFPALVRLAKIVNHRLSWHLVLNANVTSLQTVLVVVWRQIIRFFMVQNVFSQNLQFDQVIIVLDRNANTCLYDIASWMNQSRLWESVTCWALPLHFRFSGILIKVLKSFVHLWVGLLI